MSIGVGIIPLIKFIRFFGQDSSNGKLLGLKEAKQIADALFEAGVFHVELNKDIEFPPESTGKLKLGLNEQIAFHEAQLAKLKSHNK